MVKKATTPDKEKPELSLAIIEELKRKGFNQTQIAEMFGVTRQAVSWHKRTYNGTLSPREVVMENFPWVVSSQQTQCSAYRRLRDHGEYMATGGVGMKFDRIQRLKGFYKRMRDQVLEFDPDLPPVKGFAAHGGFALRPRTPQDEDLLIRVNKYATLSDEGRMIWRLPEQDDQ